MKAAFKIDKSFVRKRKLSDPDPDDGYWLNQSPQKRLEAVEFLRQNHHRNDDAARHFHRVLSITRRKSG